MYPDLPMRFKCKNLVILWGWTVLLVAYRFLRSYGLLYMAALTWPRVNSPLITSSQQTLGCTRVYFTMRKMVYLLPAFLWWALVNCGDPGTPSNGYKHGSRYWTGESVSFICDTQYHLTGPATRTCLPSGNWSGTQPSCKESYKRILAKVILENNLYDNGFDQIFTKMS